MNEMNIREILKDVDTLLKQGEEAQVEKRLQDAIDYYKDFEPNNITVQMMLLNELGGFYRNRGVLDKGEVLYLQAKILFENSTCCGNVIDDDEKMLVNYATTLNNLAGLYRMDHRYQEAIDFYEKAICIYEQVKNVVPLDYIASVYNNVGLLCLERQEVAQAKSLFLKGKELLEQDGTDVYALGTTISNLGFVYVNEKQYSKAKECFKEAKFFFEIAEATSMAENCEALLLRLDNIE